MASSYGTLINSVNLYVDTSDTIHKGDDINLQLQGQALHCMEGQNFKITLTEFSMHRPNYTVDENNSKLMNSSTDQTTQLMKTIPNLSCRLWSMECQIKLCCN